MLGNDESSSTVALPGRVTSQRFRPAISQEKGSVQQAAERSPLHLSRRVWQFSTGRYTEFTMGARFKMTMTGDGADDSLRLNDLIEQLNAVRQALNQIDVAVSGRRSPGLYYRVTALSMNSPATIEVEAVAPKDVPNYGRKVVSRFKRDLKAVLKGSRPKDSGIELLDAYKNLSQPQRKHLLGVSIQFDKELVEVPRNLDVQIDKILGPDQTEEGSIVGKLEMINIHNARNEFKIFPIVGPLSIKCKFQQAQLKEVLSGINHNVRIHGILHYKRAEQYPHAMQVHSIEQLPDRAQISKLSSLRGMAKDAFGGVPSTEYIEKVRNGDW